MADIILDVKTGIDLVLGQILAHAAVPEKHILEFRAFLPDLHGACLDDLISRIPCQALFHQFQQDAL